MSVRKLSRSLVRAVVSAQESAAHCTATITARMPVLFDGAVPPSPAALAEWNRAYSEKVQAGWQGAVVAAAEWQAMMLRSAFRVPTPVGLANDLLGIAAKAAHPARRRVKANAKRLGKRATRTI
jgi:hypothetical protein